MPEARHRRPFWYLRRSPHVIESEINEELDLHLEMRRAELEAGGMSPAEAEREARRQFGDLDRTRQYCRHQDLEKARQMGLALTVGDLGQDLKIGARGLLKVPALTATIVLTVGLGIGATTTIVGAINAVLLRPSPYADSGRLVRIYTDAPAGQYPFSVVDYLALQAEHTQLANVAGYAGRSMSFSHGDMAERLQGRLVSWTYFDVLGLRPALGRGFIEADSRPGNPPAVIVSHAFWTERLKGRPDAIGSALRLDGADYELAGVLPPSTGPLEHDQQFFAAAQWATPSRKGPFFITAIGRLKDGVDRSAAVAELKAINRRLFPIWQSSYQDERASWNINGLKAHVLGNVGHTASLALGAVGLMWLIACVNASNLLIARVTSRRSELAVRTALGASRARVIRLLLAEGALLAFGSALVGIGLAAFGTTLLRTAGATYLPRMHEVTFDSSFFCVLGVVTMASAAIFAVVPAVHGSGGPLDRSLRLLGRSTTGSVAVRHLRRVLVGSQFAIVTPLLVVAGLLVGTLHELGRVNLGFDSRGVIAGMLQLPAARYSRPGVADSFWEQVKRRVEAIPGVTGVTFADGLPPDGVNNFNNFDLEDQPTGPGESQPVTPWVSVTPEYFRVIGLTLLEGRFLDERDGRNPDVDVVVVDRSWAKRFFPNDSALGKRFKSGGCTSCPWTTIVGVVSGVKYAGLDRPDDGTAYSPLVGGRYRHLVLRTGMDPVVVLPELRRIIRDLDPELPFANVATMDERVAKSLTRARSLALLVGTLAVLALVLSTIGIYGVMSYHVQQQAKEMCIRMALGGRASDVLRIVIGQGMRVVMSGVVVGLAAALLLTRLVSALLFGVGTADPFTFISVALLLLALAVAACLVPAVRAVRLQPATVLRGD